MSTDADWEAWGRKDPYFGVITDPRFRLSAMTAEDRHEFFESGRKHAEYVLAMIHRHIDPEFRPRAILEFGCGVGRVAIPFAALAPEVTGIDVSRGMLDEAQRNCERMGIPNLRLLQSDDDLECLRDLPPFDLLHSYIVFQHIPPSRGRPVYERLLQGLTPGGMGAVHFSYSKEWFSPTHGLPPPGDPAASPVPEERLEDADPGMQMNPYNMNEILFATQRCGVDRLHAEFTNHGGEMGLFLFFRKSSA